MLARLAKLQTGVEAVDRALALVRQLVNAIAAVPILDGVEVTDTALTNGAVNKLAHKLGRKLRGWQIVDLRGATATGRIVRVLSSAGSTADDSRDLWLDVQGWGANLTVRLWVW